MQSLAILAGVGSLAHALVMPRSGCQTTLSVSGSISGSVGEISSGQARVGGGLGAQSFNYDASAGTLVDTSGKGCFFTPPTYTLQCDQGQNPTPGFHIGCDGQFSYNGQTTFYQCFSGVNNEYNLYLGPNGFECGEVTITASSCYSDCQQASVAPAPVKTITVAYHPPAQSAQPSSMPMIASTNSNGCPADLSGNYQFPHLIIPIDSSSPSTASSSSYFGEVSSSISSLFNFDVPSSYAGMTCQLEFLFPEQSQLQTSSYTFSGKGEVMFSYLSSPAVEGQTSYDSCPSTSSDMGTVTVSPGNAYKVGGSFACPSGQKVGYKMASVGGTSLRYFQDYNPCPIGLYMTAY